MGERRTEPLTVALDVVHRSPQDRRSAPNTVRTGKGTRDILDNLLHVLDPLELALPTDRTERDVAVLRVGFRIARRDKVLLGHAAQVPVARSDLDQGRVGDLRSTEVCSEIVQERQSDVVEPLEPGRCGAVAVSDHSRRMGPTIQSSLHGAWKKSSVWNTSSISSMPCRESQTVQFSAEAARFTARIRPGSPK